MKRFLPTAIALICGAVIGWSACWLRIRENQQYQPIEEAKISYYNLEEHWAGLDPQLREYLKARLYSASANYVNEGWMDGWDIDFGPVDDSVLAPVYAIKNASPTDEVYQAALLRHPRSANKNQKAEQGSAGQPATRSESNFEGSDKPQAESEGRPR